MLPTPTITLRSLLSLPAACLALALVGLLPGRALGVAGTHPTLAHFQAHARLDALFDNFNGTPGSLTTYSSGAAPGYAFTLDTVPACALIRDANGMGNLCQSSTLRMAMTGRPVTAFGGTFRILNTSFVAVAGSMTVTTDTGESFNLAVPAAGMFFGFTTTQPFNVITIATSQYEQIDDVYVGTSGAVPVQADQCVDANTVGVGAYYFNTSTALRDLNTSSCNTETTAPDVFFRFVAPSTGLVTVSTCGCTFDSILRIFNGCTGIQIACNDDACLTSNGGNTASIAQYRSSAGTAVIIRVGGYAANAGSGTLTITEQADCEADANHSGALEVQDIFEFLNRWFAGCP